MKKQLHGEICCKGCYELGIKQGKAEAIKEFDEVIRKIKRIIMNCSNIDLEIINSLIVLIDEIVEGVEEDD
jgi:hypothetical protein